MYFSIRKKFSAVWDAIFIARFLSAAVISTPLRNLERFLVVAREGGIPTHRLEAVGFLCECLVDAIESANQSCKGYVDHYNDIRLNSASLIPNLDLVAIRVGDVGVGAARTKFAPPEQLATGALDFLDGRVDVPRWNKPEAEVWDTSWLAGARRMLVKRDDILAARRPGVDQSFGPPVFLHTENLPVKPQWALNISHHKVNMR
jgi:hypothetical protein